ncbi:MAG: hypothetical protein AAGI63_15260 [Planctomycetota bacterium]
MRFISRFLGPFGQSPRGFHQIAIGSSSRFSLTLLLTLAVGSLFLSPTPATAVEEDLPSLTFLRNQTRDLLRQHATLPDGEKKNEATVALCDLYVVLRHDPRYSGSEMLKGDAVKIRRRLLSVARDLERDLRRSGTERSSQLSAEVDSAIESALAGDDTGQQSLGEQNAAAAGGLFDNGWQLVELIQRIAAPDFWEPQGGPGSIRYFAMRRVLVVRATSDVHEQVKDLLTALR